MTHHTRVVILCRYRYMWYIIVTSENMVFVTFTRSIYTQQCDNFKRIYNTSLFGHCAFVITIFHKRLPACRLCSTELKMKRNILLLYKSTLARAYYSLFLASDPSSTAPIYASYCRRTYRPVSIATAHEDL